VQYTGERLMLEHDIPEEEREIVFRSCWRVWRTARDGRLVTGEKKLLNLERAKLSRRKSKLRDKLIHIFKVQLS
jgi:hypothetical protein